MKSRIIPALIVLAAAAAALLSCTANGGSIYATIETELKAADNSLPSPKTWSVYDIAAVAGGGPYYVAAGGIYQGTLPSPITWNPNAITITVPYTPSEYPFNPQGTYAGALCNALVLSNGALWGGFYMPDGAAVGLMKSGASPSYSFANSAPIADTNGYLTGKQIYLLKALNGVLFVVAATVNTSGQTYDLDFTTDGGTTWIQSTALHGFTTPISRISVGCDAQQLLGDLGDLTLPERWRCPQFNELCHGQRALGPCRG